MRDLYYELLGSGPRLLYCNGSGATLESVRPLIAVMAARFEVLAFDYRGMGASPPVTEPYTMSDLAADVAELLDTVGWDRTALVGLSFGGMVAQEFAVTFPERLERLALLATSPGGAFASFPLEQLAELPAAERTRRTLLLADRRWTPDWLAAHPRQAAVANGFTADADEAETDTQSRGRRLQLRARAGHDVLSRLHRVSSPTLVCSGRYDDIAPVVNGRAIAERIPDATLKVYEGGHPFLAQGLGAWSDTAAFLTAGD